MTAEQRASNMAVIAAEFRAACHELEDEVERLRAEAVDLNERRISAADEAAYQRTRAMHAEAESTRYLEALQGIWRVAAAAESCAALLNDPVTAWRAAVRHIRVSAEGAMRKPEHTRRPTGSTS